MATIEEIDKLQRMDHDTIVRMESKLDVLIKNVENLTNGSTMKLNDHENRIRSLELREHDEGLRTNVFRFVVVGIFGAVVWVLTQVPDILRGWGIAK